MCVEVKRKNVWATHSTAKTPFRGRNIPVDLPTLHHEQHLPDVPHIAERVPFCGDQSCLLVKTSSSEIHLHRHLDLPHALKNSNFNWCSNRSRNRVFFTSDT